MENFKLHPDTAIGYIHLRVANLKEELGFYQDLLGFKEVKKENSSVYLSANGQLPYRMILTEDKKAPPRLSNSTGLFHLAIRVPSRKELAKTFLRLHENNYPFHGFADHGVSEALYMADPEGNGVEIYFDRPRENWPYENGQLAMVTDPLDLDELIAELKDERYEWQGIHPQTDIGHIHLQVSDLGKARDFYHAALGMDVVQDTFPGALFMSAGGYHHHVGANIWSSRGAKIADARSRGLAAYSVLIPDHAGMTDLLKRLEENGFEPQVTGGRVFVGDGDRNRVELIFSETNNNSLRETNDNR